jgi:SAM-dependent methyltransferase
VSHYQQTEFVKTIKRYFPLFFERGSVLEVGSADINGSIRNLFTGCDYIGVDVAAGDGVDIVKPGQDLDLPDASFDVVISCECFEHNQFWRETFLNMVRMLRPGGLCIFTCGGLGRREHGTRRSNPDSICTAIAEEPDYYRNLSGRDFERCAELRELFGYYEFFTNIYFRDLYFVGMKRGGNVQPDVFSSIRRDVRKIKSEHPMPFWRPVPAALEWFVKAGLARLLGEARFHDLNYRRGSSRKKT